MSGRPSGPVETSMAATAQIAHLQRLAVVVVVTVQGALLRRCAARLAGRRPYELAATQGVLIDAVGGNRVGMLGSVSVDVNELAFRRPTLKVGVVLAVLPTEVQASPVARLADAGGRA